MALQPQPQLQMSWQPSLSLLRKTRPPIGLKNLGNSCYLNSVLQCLTYTPPLANFCLRNLHSSLCDSSSKRDCPFCILEKRIARSLKADLTHDSPVKILSCLRLFAQQFRAGRQEDAHEFLRYVIDACHNTGAGATATTIFKEIFGGSLQSQVKCFSCGAESNKVDEVMDISLDVLYSASLQEALHKFFQPEFLDGNNKYRCDNCKKLVVARKQMSVFQAPNILVIQLKRFEGTFGGKIDKVISFDQVLVLSAFMCKASQDPSPEYNLFGTIVHAGCSPDSGHYYAYIKDALDRWYCCNDTYVSLATLEEVLSEKVYMLFFSRTKQRPSSSISCSPYKGVKSQHCTGNGTLNCEMSDLLSKPSQVKPVAEVSSWRDVSATAKDKMQFGPRMKFNIAGNAGSKRVPALTNGKVENHLAERKKKMDSQVNKSEGYKSTLSCGNVHDKENKLVSAKNKKNQTTVPGGWDEDDGIILSIEEKNKVRASETENSSVRNAGLDSVKSVLCESNAATNTEVTLREANHHKLRNGNIPSQPDASRSKRKLEDGWCILLAQDAESCSKVEELKELLENDALSELRRCWSRDLSSFMRSQKESYASETENTSVPADYLKKKLVEDAKSKFIPGIPKYLKEHLIGRLRSLSQERG